ncbi:NAD-dependent epimerase/dehydratase [Penicillium hetheringtonii]|uniref:NAD-dependent epimerase/dehydratase n=1 Tax=Penicillium hetheringtonii TaxID=911720 RepID=A0AAD6DRH8_9EURO|nr:NAD-dependent epimerase/dehydratase [Penicillium hetheringtonii]
MPTTLITGATGFIGSQVTLSALKAGYNTRLVIRREEQATKLRTIFSQYASQLDFAIVPDITVAGIDYVIHLASPIPSAGTSDLLTPAIHGTVSVLESAVKIPSIRKVVITGSVLSLVPLKPIGDGTVITENNDIDFTMDPGQVRTLDPMSQYHASKLAAHKATLDFYTEKKPSFDIVTLHPVFVYGHSLVQETADQLGGTNGLLFQSLFSEKPSAGQYLGVHVEDVALAHIKALDGNIRGLQSYLLASPRRSWSEVKAFVQSQYPSLPIKLDAADDRVTYTVDTTRAMSDLGIHFKGMEQQVQDVVDQQLKLRL